MEQYTNKELYLIIKNVEKALKIGFDGIHERQNKTNGNINNNSAEISKLKVWRGFITGGLAIISLIVIPVAIIWIRSIL